MARRALTALLAASLLVLSPAPSAAYKLWAYGSSSAYPTTYDSNQISTAFSALGHDGFIQSSGGCSALDFSGLPVGITVLRLSYLGADWAVPGSGFRIFPKGAETFRADSTGAVVTGDLSVSGKATASSVVATDSLRVGSSGSARTLTVSGDASIYGVPTIYGTTVNLSNASFAGIVATGNVPLKLGGYNSTTSLQVDPSGAGTGVTVAGGGRSDSLRANSGLYVGQALVKKILTATATLDFNLTSVTCQELGLSVPGAQLGDAVFIGPYSTTTSTDFLWSGYVDSANSVTIKCCRQGAATPNPPSNQWRVVVFSY